MKKQAILGLGLALVLTGSALAAPPKSSDDKAANSVTMDDKSWVAEAAKGGAEEVRLGQLAATKGSSPAVKAFGQHMVTDHSKANKELLALAAKKNIKIDNKKNDKSDSDFKKLNALSGADFDRQYMDMMVKDHKEDVDSFKKEADKGGDANLKAWANKTLPVLQSHLKMAEDTQAKLPKVTK